jgi:RNA polymerase sigma-70 factor (ECF subfamily)
VINETLNFIKSGKRFSELDSKLISTDKNPEQKYIDNEVGVQVQSALLELNPEYRILILLKHFQHCTYQEISESLSLPVKKVKSRLYSARQMLKDILIRKGSL